ESISTTSSSARSYGTGERANCGPRKGNRARKLPRKPLDATLLVAGALCFQIGIIVPALTTDARECAKAGCYFIREAKCQHVGSAAHSIIDAAENATLFRGRAIPDRCQRDLLRLNRHKANFGHAIEPPRAYADR